MRILSTFLRVSFCCFIILFSCNSDDDAQTYEEELAELNILKTQIEDFASSSICNDAFECQYIAFGSKPCGGPSTFLIFSTSIDTDQLESMVANYNQLKAEFNVRWGLISDCSVPLPPSGFECENNTCIPVY